MQSIYKYNGRNISFISSGKGDVIVLLHGYLESKEIWESFAQQLSRDFRVICVDLPGHGTSEVYGDIHTMEYMASAVKSLTDHLGINSFFLAGHSLGGYVSLAFADLFPGALTGYCLFHSQPFADTPAAVEKRNREIEVVKAGKKNLMYPDNIMRMYATSNLEKFSGALERSKEIASRIPAEGIIAILNGMIARNSRLNIVESGKIPLLWILGAMDNYIPADISGRVKLPSNSEVVILKNSGHMGFIEEEQLSLDVMRKFISRNRAAR